MASAYIAPSLAVPGTNPVTRAEREEAVASVLGTMRAEGELPSEATQAVMEQYVDGAISLDEMVETILARARG